MTSARASRDECRRSDPDERRADIRPTQVHWNAVSLRREPVESDRGGPRRAN